ncbi:hypothetical protein G6F37_007576 [Rhizopus arrhizus]|nr:hypothetical protein G6F38_007214 [Rhizopus arrhizus]KAG1156467.1 hypothetical protein G6F37_007576 [Rhizopus arrhizus]
MAETTQVLKTISKSSEIIRFQAKTAVGLYEQTSDILQSATDVQQIQGSCKHLAIYGIITAKDQESEARLYATKAMDLPPSLRHLEHADDDTKTTNAFTDDFIKMVNKAKWENNLL